MKRGFTARKHDAVLVSGPILKEHPYNNRLTIVLDVIFGPCEREQKGTPTVIES